MDLEAQEDRPDSWYNVQCKQCGKRFHLKPYKVNVDKNHYCSRKCHYEAKREYMKGDKNHQYGLVGDKNASWQGGRKISKYGYYAVQCIGHPFARGRSHYVFEHRLIAEKYLLNDENSVEINGKRYLSPDYVVHHKNKNRKDNRLENLIVMTYHDHQSLHSKEQNAKRQRDEFGRYVS